VFIVVGFDSSHFSSFVELVSDKDVCGEEGKEVKPSPESDSNN